MLSAIFKVAICDLKQQVMELDVTICDFQALRCQFGISS